MLSSDDLIPLDLTIDALRRTAPEVLAAIAKAVGDHRPSDRLSSGLVHGATYKGPILGFYLTYGQLSAYLDLAVSKHASVIIETGAGVIESRYVSINRSWLLAQSEQLAMLPTAAKAISQRLSGTAKASVRPLYPHLDEQTPEASREELRRLKIQVQKALALPGVDQRDREIEQLRAQVAALTEEKGQADELAAALAKTLRMLTIENDQLRKARAKDATLNVATLSPAVPVVRDPTNVEKRNDLTRRVRDAVATYARGMWESPDLANCRTGEMARLVRATIDPAIAALLPKTDVTLGRWLTKDAAPSSAKRKGRPSSTRSKK